MALNSNYTQKETDDFTSKWIHNEYTREKAREYEQDSPLCPSCGHTDWDGKCLKCEPKGGIKC